MVEVTDEMIALLREYQMGAYGELDDDCDKRMIAALIELHEENNPKPEPVAWIVWNGWTPVSVTLSEEKAKSYAQGRQLHSDLSGDFNAYRAAPLYSIPPIREPLSDYELREMLNELNEGDGTIYDFARAIEQAHGIGESNRNDLYQKVQRKGSQMQH